MVEMDSPSSPPEPDHGTQGHGEEEQEDQNYWMAVHQALGHDEHGVLLDNAAIASELARLMNGSEPLSPWETRRKDALMRALEEM